MALERRSAVPHLMGKTKDLVKLAKERLERDDEDLVRLYLTDIGQYPLLTKDDEVRLAQAIEAGREADAQLACGPEGPDPGQEARVAADHPAG